MAGRVTAGRRALPGLLLGLLASAARSQPAAWPLPYEQSGIAVEVAGAADGVIARDQAYGQALRQAWLLLKLALAQPLARASDRQIGDMVAAILVEQEHVSPHGYRGRLTVRFDPHKVAAVAGIAPPAPEEPPAETEAVPQWEARPDIADPAMPPLTENGGEAAAPTAPGPQHGGAPFWFRW